MALQIPQEVKKAITFIFVENNKGEKVPNGTGFFVSLINEVNPQLTNVYLVTAKHVLLDNNTGSLLSSVFIRLNTKTEGSQWIQIFLNGPNAVKVFNHEDKSVDISLISFVPNFDIFDYRTIPQKMITTKEMFTKSDIKEGDDVFFVGLFAHFFGKDKNYPIVRFGKVALIADEKIPWKEKKEKPPEMLDLYLIEISSFGGNSGSPVFFYLGATREPGKLRLGNPELLLAGIMKGAFLDAKEIQMAETRKFPYSLDNLGIAAVVPAYRLNEMLLSEELKQSRTVEKK